MLTRNAYPRPFGDVDNLAASWTSREVALACKWNVIYDAIHDECLENRDPVLKKLRVQADHHRMLAESWKARLEAGRCYHDLPLGECKVRRCRLNKANATMARLSKKYKWFGVRENL
jgi:hypothetical protein